MREFMPSVTAIARELLLENPDLMNQASTLKNLVRQEVGSQNIVFDRKRMERKTIAKLMMSPPLGGVKTLPQGSPLPISPNCLDSKVLCDKSKIVGREGGPDHDVFGTDGQRIIRSSKTRGGIN